MSEGERRSTREGQSIGPPFLLQSLPSRLPSTRTHSQLATHPNLTPIKLAAAKIFAQVVKEELTSAAALAAPAAPAADALGASRLAATTTTAPLRAELASQSEMLVQTVKQEARLSSLDTFNTLSHSPLPDLASKLDVSLENQVSNAVQAGFEDVLDQTKASDLMGSVSQEAGKLVESFKAAA